MSVDVTRSPAEAPSLELVLKRNPVERLKREKGPLGMLAELPALIAVGYADVAEEEAALGDTGRILLRPSGTEPLVRVMVEAATQEEARSVAERLADVVKRQLAL